MPKETKIKYLQEPYDKNTKSIISKIFPKLTVNKIDVKSFGSESVIAIINDALVCKFPKKIRGIEGIKKEHILTNFLRKKIATPIPEIEYHNIETPFISYPFVKGKALDHICYHKFSKKQQEGFEDSMVQFFHEMHTIKQSDVKKLPISLEPWVKYKSQSIFNRCPDDIEEHIKDWLFESLKQFELLEKKEKTKKVFGHFDCHGSNIIVSPDSLALRGIIDFGFASIGNLYQDLSFLNVSSPSIMRRVVNKYCLTTNKVLNFDMIDLHTTVIIFSCMFNKNNPHPSWKRRFLAWYQHVFDVEYSRIFSYEWRVWIAENLMKDVKKSAILYKLRMDGFGKIPSERQIYWAEHHPYIEAGKKLLAKQKQKHTNDK